MPNLFRILTNRFIQGNLLLVFGLTLLLSATCAKEKVSDTPVIPPVSVTKTLKEKALFPIGAAVTVAHPG